MKSDDLLELERQTELLKRMALDLAGIRAILMKDVMTTPASDYTVTVGGKFE